MRLVKCFDIVMISVDEATSRFAYDYVVNKEYLSILSEYCEAFDRLSKKFGVESITSWVDDNKLIHISFDFSDVVVQDEETYPFYDLMDRAVDVKFYYKDGAICVEFVFPSIWE